MIKSASITLTSKDTDCLSNPDTITVSIVDNKFVDSVCSSDIPIMEDFPLNDVDKKELRSRLIKLVSGDSRVNIWRGREAGWNMYFAIRNGHIIHLKLLSDVIESLNANDVMLCIDYDADIE